jgi:hypothetical protein
MILRWAGPDGGESQEKALKTIAAIARLRGTDTRFGEVRLTVE